MAISHRNFVAGRGRPSAELVAKAEREYAEARTVGEELIAKTRALLEAGWTDLEAVVDVFATLHVQRGDPATLISAAAVVRLAKTNAPDIDVGGG